MKTVALLRHAKSSWNETDLPDYERALSERGLIAAPLLGSAIKKLDLKPDLILCSPSKRTMQTLELAKINIQKDRIFFDRDIYLATSDLLIEKIHQLSNQIYSVLIVGHNPGLQNLAVHLAQVDNAEYIKNLKIHFPTGSLIIFEFLVDDWRKVKIGSGKVKHFVIPKQLSSGNS